MPSDCSEPAYGGQACAQKGGNRVEASPCDWILHPPPRISRQARPRNLSWCTSVESGGPSRSFCSEHEREHCCHSVTPNRKIEVLSRFPFLTPAWTMAGSSTPKRDRSGLIAVLSPDSRPLFDSGPASGSHPPKGRNVRREVTVYEFACDACGSPAVVYPDALKEDAAVVCARCAAKICSYGDFRRRVEQMIHFSIDGTGVTGC
jgi:predicted nucleic acid-binding Zn ribbon protein